MVEKSIVVGYSAAASPLLEINTGVETDVGVAESALKFVSKQLLPDESQGHALS